MNPRLVHCNVEILFHKAELKQKSKYFQYVKMLLVHQVRLLLGVKYVDLNLHDCKHVLHVQYYSQMLVMLQSMLVNKLLINNNANNHVTITKVLFCTG